MNPFRTQINENILTLLQVGLNYCTVSTASATSLTCTIDHNNSMDIGITELVTVNVYNRGLARNTIKNEMARRFAFKPEVTSVSPTTGSTNGGTNITITGSGFIEGQTTVTLKNSPCAVITMTYTQIVCKTPADATGSTQNVVVTSKGIPAVGSFTFAYSSSVTPTVASISPTRIVGTTNLTITGTNFGSNVSNLWVTVGSAPCTIQAVTSTEVTCTLGPLPRGPHSVSFSVNGVGLATIASGFSSLQSPRIINSVTPATGGVNGGTLLTIKGNGFHVDSTVVTVADRACVVSSVTIDTIECSTGAAPAGQASLVVTSGGSSYDSTTFTYTAEATPSVTSVSPTSGSTSTSVTIVGTKFTTVTGDVTVKMGGAPCSVTSSTETQIVCVTSANTAGSHNVSVIIAQKGLATSTATFTYDLQISTVSPAEGKSCYRKV